MATYGEDTAGPIAVGSSTALPIALDLKAKRALAFRRARHWRG
jgi:hypothetical protein